MSNPLPTSSQQSNILPTLAGKKVLLGISGGIAAYKAAELVRQLRKANAIVQVVMTTNGSRFITPLTLQTLSERPVYCDAFDSQFETEIGHIKLARWADIIAIYPASANCIAKLAHGMADDLLTTLVVASEATTVVAPAMNSKMWLKPSTQNNVKQLRQYGMQIVEPAIGEQACHENGPGRLVEPDTMVTQLQQQFTPQWLKGKTVVISAGRTEEALDPIRYLSNHSSGKMGYALAQAAAAAGAKTTLISGPTYLDCPPAVECIAVTTAEQMHKATIAAMPCDIFIAAAAVANYRPANYNNSKIKSTADSLTLELVANPDILQTVAHSNHASFTVGFSAETDDHLENSRAKLIRKGADMIIANHVRHWPMGGVNNEVTVLTRAGGRIDLPQAAKPLLAQQLIALIAEKYHLMQLSQQQSTV
ncbi:MAG: bifunctional phosphopantothenoylcysteine decarboxylase/phosphopantothenate--cysteine ligase CoaBC [Gammaproteobacteria bacterium]|nr:bifunctional phosphopantothenoylcysteine decarboxylase/phosphopantothenate--cysteine ligase CoaBC [Gammaproteobacteria bacterium]